MSTSVLDSIVTNLAASKDRWEQISRASGVPFGTLRKIGWGQTRNPRFETVAKLDEYFRKHPARPTKAA